MKRNKYQQKYYCIKLILFYFIESRCIPIIIHIIISLNFFQQNTEEFHIHNN